MQRIRAGLQADRLNDRPAEIKTARLFYEEDITIVKRNKNKKIKNDTVFASKKKKTLSNCSFLS
jgi:hypothetical protein